MTFKTRLQQLERLIRPGLSMKFDEVTEVRKADEDEPEEIEVTYLRITTFESDGTPIVSVLLPKNGRDDHLISENNIGGRTIS